MKHLNTSMFLVLMSSLLLSSMEIDLYATSRENDEEVKTGNYKRGARDKGAEKCTYDFIIIGAGVGGSVLAGRLTENPSYSVCLLEAGQEADNPLISFPISWPFLYFNAKHDWSFWTKPLNDDPATRLFAWPRGKMLGGSSNHNAVQWSWGGQWVYDSWQNNLGLSEWGYNDIQPYLQKAEHVFGLLDGQPVDYTVRGNSGPIPIRQTKIMQDINNEFLSFSRTEEPAGLGLASFSDINLATVPGFAWGQQNVNDQYLRVSAYDAYVKPFIHTRPQLTVKVGAIVTRIILDKNNVATGVEYICKGKLKRIFSRKEVLLCAGVAQSPKILMHSGIGPKDVLASTVPEAVPLRLELPGVGKNVQDHIFCSLFYGVDKVPQTIYPGPFSPLSPYTNFLDLDGFVSLSNTSSLDFEFVPILAPVVAIKEANVFGSIIANGSVPVPEGTAFIIAPTFLLTKNQSRGEITIHSNNPLDPPIITPPYFNDPENSDLARLVAVLKKTRDIFEKFSAWLKSSPSNLNGENIQITGEVLPGVSVITDAQIKNYLLGFSVPSTHQVGGCSMGLSPAQGAVVDRYFNVFGIKKLRIVDGSVFPSTTQTRPSATIYAMAERASDFIKAKYASRAISKKP